jgi:fluoride exporter
MIRQILLVGSGGAAGSIVRFLINRAMAAQGAIAFPISTFVINLTGCFLIGVFSGIFLGDDAGNIQWKLLLVTGFCGGYTTFSAYSAENLRLLQSGQISTAVAYILLSTVIGIAAVWLGIKLIK